MAWAQLAPEALRLVMPSERVTGASMAAGVLAHTNPVTVSLPLELLRVGGRRGPPAPAESAVLSLRALQRPVGRGFARRNSVRCAAAIRHAADALVRADAESRFRALKQGGCPERKGAENTEHDENSSHGNPPWHGLSHESSVGSISLSGCFREISDGARQHYELPARAVPSRRTERPASTSFSGERRRVGPLDAP